MTATLILSPPETPRENEATNQKAHKTRYKRIRFKNWQPEPPKETKQAQNERSHPKSNEKESEDAPNDDIAVESVLRTAVRRRYSPSQPLPVNGTRMDPFTELPIKADGIVPATLDYFLSICAPVDKEGFSVSGHPNPHMTMLFPFMCQHSLLFESIITLCRASILLCVGKSASEDKALLYHRARTMEGVSKALSTDEAVNDDVLLSVAMLLTLEYLIGNIAAVAAHQAGLNRMVALREDLDDGTPWKKFVKAGLDAYKSLGSFVTGQPPEVANDSHGFIHETFAGLSLDKSIDYPKLPFSPDLCTILSRLPPGFSEICLSGRLSMQTMQILASLHGTTTSYLCEHFDDTRLDTELQATLSALQRLSLMQIGGLEKYLTCGLVAFAFQLRHLRPLNLFHDPPLRTFIRIIPHQEKPDSDREQACMIWTTMAVAGALALRSIRMPGTHLVLDRLFRVYPATTVWDTLEQTLRSFLHTPDILAHWKRCHATGLARWNHLARVRAANPEPLIDLFGLSVKLPAGAATIGAVGAETNTQGNGEGITADGNADGDADGDEDEDEDAIKSLTMEQISTHLRQTPKDMMDLMRAARCPFQARMKSMGVGTETMVNPHGPGMGLG